MQPPTSAQRPTLFAKGNFGRVYVDATHRPSLLYKVQYATPYSAKQRNIRKEIQLQQLASRQCQYVPKIREDVIIPSLHRWWCMLRWCTFTFAMEQAPGDTLHNHLSVHHTAFTVLHTQRIVTQLIEAVNHLHSVGIVHRDIKNDNIMIEMPLAKLQIIDFGLATYRVQPYDTHNPMRTALGTLLYSCPQMVFGQTYTAKCDWWSVGVICYVLLFGLFPFALRTSTIRDYVMFQMGAEERTMYKTPLLTIQDSSFWPAKNDDEYDTLIGLYKVATELLIVKESIRCCTMGKKPITSTNGMSLQRAVYNMKDGIKKAVKSTNNTT